jgi:hypothetical protein
MSTVTIEQPTGQEITDWWQWAAGFTGDKTPFAIGKGENIVDQAQNKSTYCLSCTGGKGGKDIAVRNLRPAIAAANKDILIPVYVAGAENLDEANEELGSSPSITLEINGVDRSNDAKKVTIDIAQVNFQGTEQTNTFKIAGHKAPFHTVGFWAKVPSSQKNQLVSVKFGGNGGKISAGSPDIFETEVTYRLT